MVYASVFWVEVDGGYRERFSHRYEAMKIRRTPMEDTCGRLLRRILQQVQDSCGESLRGYGVFESERFLFITALPAFGDTQLHP
jgi:hypothetical protein